MVCYYFADIDIALAGFVRLFGFWLLAFGSFQLLLCGYEFL
jgi:hypothetical protein